MYALHPSSLPPHGPKATTRLEVSATDLRALYGVSEEDSILWDPADGYDWFDFIHLYPSYYDRYTLKTDGTPEKDIPECVTKTLSSLTKSLSTPKTVSHPVIRCAKTKR